MPESLKNLLLLTIALVLLVAESAAATEPRVSSYLESPRNFGLDLMYSPLKYPNYDYSLNDSPIYVAGGGNSGGLTLEYLAIQSLGKLGIGIGAGFFVLSDVNVGKDATGADILATLYTYPLQAYLSYRFDYFKNQVLVPYVRFGGEMTPTRQGSKTGGDKAGTQVYYGTNLAAGLELLLNVLEPSSAVNLDRSTGINGTYLIVEYEMGRAINPSNVADLSHNAIRAGLRFEF